MRALGISYRSADVTGIVIFIIISMRFERNDRLLCKCLAAYRALLAVGKSRLCTGSRLAYHRFFGVCLTRQRFGRYDLAARTDMCLQSCFGAGSFFCNDPLDAYANMRISAALISVALISVALAVSAYCADAVNVIVSESVDLLTSGISAIHTGYSFCSCLGAGGHLRNNRGPSVIRILRFFIFVLAGRFVPMSIAVINPFLRINVHVQCS